MILLTKRMRMNFSDRRVKFHVGWIICLMILAPGIMHAQTDYCKNITREVKEAEGIATYRTPLVGKQTILSISKTIEDTSASYSLYIGVMNEVAALNAKGISVTLEDGSEYKSAEARIGSTMVDVNKYNLSGSLGIEEQDIEAFGNSRIVKVSCAGVMHVVSKEEGMRFMEYLRCLMDR